MQERLERKFVVVTRRTRLKEMVARHSTLSQARFRARAEGSDWAGSVLPDLRSTMPICCPLRTILSFINADWISVTDLSGPLFNIFTSTCCGP